MTNGDDELRAEEDTAKEELLMVDYTLCLGEVFKDGDLNLSPCPMRERCKRFTWIRALSPAQTEWQSFMNALNIKDDECEYFWEDTK